MRLTDYITQAVEAHMAQQAIQITIPSDVRFADLGLQRDPDGAVSFDWAPIEKICAASGIDVAILCDGPEDIVGALIAHWYTAHREDGGAPDPAAEDLLSEIRAEDAAGQHVSLPPGRA